MSELELRGVTKRLGDHTAVDDVSFRVSAGEFFVLLGSSGSGKSTTLRLICGLERADAGEIILAGRDISQLPPRERNLGMVFQEYGLYPAMDVRGNISYGLEARRAVSKDEIRRRVVEAAAKLELSDMLDRSTQDLSGGEQQRVALARAMVKDADAFLFDEPLSNLDPKLRYRARRDIMTVHREKHQPSVYVTHDQSEAFAMADRVAVMAQGRLQQVGTPDELLSAPANAFVARFVGSPPMNLVAAEIRGTSVVADGISIPLSSTWTQALTTYDKAQVLVGFRPESVRQSTNGSAALDGKVLDAEPGMTEMIVRFVTTGGAHITAVFDDDVELQPGDPVRFDVDTDRLHLFDPMTEQALSYE